MIEGNGITLDPGHDPRFTAIRVLSGHQRVGRMNVRNRLRDGLAVGTIHEVRRDLLGVAPGAFSIAYGLLMTHGIYGLLRSGDAMSDDAVRLWSNLRAPDGFSVFRCRNTEGEARLGDYEEERPGVIQRHLAPHFGASPLT